MNEEKDIQQLIRTGTQSAEAIQQVLLRTNLSSCNTLQLLALHHSLLFLLAYPDDKPIYTLVKEYYNTFRNHCFKKLKGRYNILLPGADVIAQFSFHFIQSQKSNLSNQIVFDNAYGNKETSTEILNTLLTRCETEQFESHTYSFNDWLKKHQINKLNAIDYLLSLVQDADANTGIKEILFNRLEVFVRLIQCDAPFYQKELVKQVFTYKELSDSNQKKQSAFELKKNQSGNEDSIKWIYSSQLVLAALHRETDPVTFASDATIYTTSNGFDIALFQMLPEKRLALESYIGYMVYRNGVACAYGGGWIFSGQCKIGINIFPYLRGGASVQLFTDLLNTYKKLFNISTFTVEPYQIGRNNPDGIKSGAFWFYYKFGFRPLLHEHRTLAESEMSKISTNKSYRSPAAVLKKLAESDLIWYTKSTSENFIHPYLVNEKLTNLTLSSGYSDYSLPEFITGVVLPEDEKLILQLFKPLLFYFSKQKLNKKDLKELSRYVISKIRGNEFEAIAAQHKLQRHFQILIEK